ncbi:hypothetical protein CPter291_4901 [Collimonas pratensis]|uniref:Uncharacterized protein n=1 Tax=Collimonas pratensis TaxID=279113 RepID=A0ABN4MGR0_9BURK|nr:hypothetical protein CPter291_4901 [Collimonas pratensis]
MRQPFFLFGMLRLLLLPDHIDRQPDQQNHPELQANHNVLRHDALPKK